MSPDQWPPVSPRLLVETVEGPCAYVGPDHRVAARNEAFAEWARRHGVATLEIRADGAWLVAGNEPPLAVRAEAVAMGGWLVLPAGGRVHGGVEAVTTSVGRALDRLSTSIESNVEMALRERPGERVAQALRQALAAVGELQALRRQVAGINPVSPPGAMQTLDVAALVREAVMALSGPPPVRFTGEERGCVVRAGREPLFVALAGVAACMCRSLPDEGYVTIDTSRDDRAVRVRFHLAPAASAPLGSPEVTAFRAVVEAAGGRLVADTGAGLVAEFPAFEGSRPQAPAERGTVLVADDDPATLSMMGAVLRRRGFGVIEAPNGVAASALLRTHAASLVAVVTDAVLPGRSGVELLAEVRALHPQLPTLLVTAHDAAVVGGGSHPVLRKPFGPQLFADSVDQVLGQGL